MGGKNTTRFDRVRDKVWIPKLYIKIGFLTAVTISISTVNSNLTE